MHKPGKQPWRWLIILTTSLAIIFATIPASYKCLKCMNCGRRSLNDHETCCTWDKWPIQSHRPRSDYGNRPGVVKFVMIRNAHAENYEFVSFPEMRTSGVTMEKEAISGFTTTFTRKVSNLRITSYIKKLANSGFITTSTRKVSNLRITSYPRKVGNLRNPELGFITTITRKVNNLGITSYTSQEATSGSHPTLEK